MMKYKSARSRIIIIVCIIAIAAVVVLCAVLFAGSADNTPAGKTSVDAFAEINGQEENSDSLQSEQTAQTEDSGTSGSGILPDSPSGAEKTAASEKQSLQTGQESGPQKKVTPEPVKPSVSSAAKDYEKYCAMSADEQYAYYKTFDSPESFLKWYNSVRDAYEKEHPATVLEPGEAIDLGN